MADAFDQTGPIADAGVTGRWDWAFAKAWLEREMKSEFGAQKSDRDERGKEGSS